MGLTYTEGRRISLTEEANNKQANNSFATFKNVN